MIGFSLSPGGLLLPYHIGVLSSLSQNNILTPEVPIVGSSAGAIAVAAHACNIPPKVSVDATIRLSDKLEAAGGIKSGQLLSCLEDELEELLPDNAHEIYNSRSGLAGLAYRQLFPSFKNILKTEFSSRNELIEG